MKVLNIAVKRFSASVSQFKRYFLSVKQKLLTTYSLVKILTFHSFVVLAFLKFDNDV